MRELEHLQDKLSDLIHEVKDCFNEPVKVAIVVKNPSCHTKNVFIGDATEEDVHQAIAELATDCTVIEAREAKLV